MHVIDKYSKTCYHEYCQTSAHIHRFTVLTHRAPAPAPPEVPSRSSTSPQALNPEQLLRGKCSEPNRAVTTHDCVITRCSPSPEPIDRDPKDDLGLVYYFAI